MSRLSHFCIFRGVEQKKRSDQRNYHILYRTTCTVTNRHYTGIYSTDNLEDGYLGSGIVLNRSINKHGSENHVREILEFCIDRKTLRQREREIVNEEFLRDSTCMNLAIGGNSKLHTEEAKHRMSGRIPWNKNLTKMSDERIKHAARNLSQTMKGRTKETHAHIARHAEFLRGRTKENNDAVARMAESKRVPWSKNRRLAYDRGDKTFSDETKKRMSDVKHGKKHPFFGKHHTDDTKQKISKALRGKKLSKEHRKKLSIANKKRWQRYRDKCFSEENNE